MVPDFPSLALRPLTLLCAALLIGCGQQSTPSALNSDASSIVSEAEKLEAQAITSTKTLLVGQQVQVRLTVGGQPVQPGQVKWTSTNANVVSVTQTGLISAKATGQATVRATVVASPQQFLEIPLIVQAGHQSLPNPTPATPSSSYAQQVFQLTNQARASARQCGSVNYAAAPALSYNAALEKAAQAHAADMAQHNYFDHSSLDGRSFAQRISAAGYPWSRAAENIAAGQPTPAQVVSGWLSSPGHCANIMNPNLKDIGVGYAVNSSSTYGQYWVQDFGSR